MTGDEIDYAWLTARYDLQVIQPLPVESRIGAGAISMTTTVAGRSITPRECALTVSCRERLNSIRPFGAHHGRVRGKLMKEFPVLQEAGLAHALKQAVADGFADLPDAG